MGSSAGIALGYMVLKDAYSHLEKEDDDVRRLVNKLVVQVKNAIVSECDFVESVNDLLDDVFLLRIHSVQQAEKEGFQVDEIFEAISNDFSGIEDAGDLEELLENVKFGIRAFIRVGKKENNLNFVKISQEIHNTTYSHFKNILKFALDHVPQKMANNYLNMFESSLIMEAIFFVVHTLVYQRDHIDVSKEKIGKISELMAQSAQLYGASAIGLGILGNRTKTAKLPKIDQNELAEQVRLAELGMDDYLNQITLNE